jgi:hypothetical protein
MGVYRPGAIRCDSAVFDPHVQLVDFSDAKILERFSSFFDRILRRFLPGSDARSDQLNDLVGTLAHPLLLSGARLNRFLLEANRRPAADVDPFPPKHLFPF